MPHPKLDYTLIAFDLTRERALLFRSTPYTSALHNLVDLALERGARIISIRAIHRLPIPKEDP